MSMGYVQLRASMHHFWVHWLDIACNLDAVWVLPFFGVLSNFVSAHLMLTKFDNTPKRGKTQTASRLHAMSSQRFD